MLPRGRTNHAKENQRLLPELLSWKRLMGTKHAFVVPPKACQDMEPKLKVLRVKADGRCMFRSIAKCLAWLKGRKLEESTERGSADMLRDAAYRVICVKKRDWFAKMGFVEGDIESYCNRMRYADFFGGEPELYVLSEDVLKRPIAVYMKNPGGQFNKLLEYGTDLVDRKKKPLRLLYNGYNHYDSLVEEEEEEG
mmetsp:Transcript_8254/g.24806  ORF Transcript_8254/g.24806 Transcript_8254/m.24806 type:complete len:195 (-) Transcript_8254:161-745(-)|eukprot:CAMPEP_0198730912 /NCGR_PEP_ID=MMETSP1475-20131203/27076_1 /TAXON_ID= ORGANISM="Unidentified sp., Strain CCMP1999" /NCGR_SAMPLE_ID=MMETSP1475 /ASSEMBLY_ACC=CAM_ASM_001111 /LENGTH=194 /DNA_ID=CAMNT_0044493803 /DNA_START=105 /DNA_END=689 /DNA_ORIENTATION=-